MEDHNFKDHIEVSGWQNQTKAHFTHIVYQPFSRVLPSSFTLYDGNTFRIHMENMVSHFETFVVREAVKK